MGAGVIFFWFFFFGDEEKIREIARETPREELTRKVRARVQTGKKKRNFRQRAAIPDCWNGFACRTIGGSVNLSGRVAELSR